MATYPNVEFKSKIVPRNNGRTTLISESGAVFGVSLDSVDVFDITIIHPYIDSTAKTTLDNFYSTNKNNENAITIHGTTYDFRLVGPYSVTTHTSTLFTMTAQMRGVEQ